jgi:hypothetical protein
MLGYSSLIQSKKQLHISSFLLTEAQDSYKLRVAASGLFFMHPQNLARKVLNPVDLLLRNLARSPADPRDLIESVRSLPRTEFDRSSKDGVFLVGFMLDEEGIYEVLFRYE